MGKLLKKRRIVISRLKRNILAEWQPVDINSPDLVQTITDAMAASTQIQIEYEGSGWRLIQPYGWNTSKDGNVLLMCYKDTGEIRSYRLDRVVQVLVDSSQLANQPIGPLSPADMYQSEDYTINPEDYEIPALPNMDEILEVSENEPGRELPYDDALEYLTTEHPNNVEEPIDKSVETPINESTDEAEHEIIVDEDEADEEATNPVNKEEGK